MAKARKGPNQNQRATRSVRAPMSDAVYEAKLLVDLLPLFRDSVNKDELPLSFILKKGRDRAEANARRGSRWTAAQRQAASDRMKKRWAAKRRAEKTSPRSGSALSKRVR